MANPGEGAPPTRDELIALVSKAHHDSGYGDSTSAGKLLAAQSKLPKVIAENLGAGFGQWTFFPEAAEIVDFACAYVPPSSAEDIWAMARTWASDDAASRPTLMNLVGREIMQHELRRIEVPSLRELVDEIRPARILALRTSLGLAVPEQGAAKPAGRRKMPGAAGAPSASPRTTEAAPKREIPARMPKPAFVPPPKKAPAAPAKQFAHPKFGKGVLEKQEGEGPDAKLTIKFDEGTKTLLARFVTEVLGA